MIDLHVFCQVAVGIECIVTLRTHLEQFHQLMMNIFHVVVQVLPHAYSLACLVVTVWAAVNVPLMETLHVLLKFLGCRGFVHALTALQEGHLSGYQ